MKGDFSRNTFKQEKNYSGVLKQQGRVSLDADWNESSDIIAHHRQTRTIDTIGLCGAPVHTNGFEIRHPGSGLKDLLISTGRFYSDGLLCELHPTPKIPITYPAGTNNQVQVGELKIDTEEIERDQWVEISTDEDPKGILSQITDIDPDTNTLTLDRDISSLHGGTTPRLGQMMLYSNQLDCPDAPDWSPVNGRKDLIYLDVWERHITAIEDPDVREKALGGPDTATRIHTIAQVKILPNVGDVRCSDEIQGFNEEIAPSGGRLKTQTQVGTEPEDPCMIAEGGGYRGLENRLYRVEIHEGGNLGDATFKWSRDNGSIAYEIKEFIPDDNNPGKCFKISLKHLGRDQVLSIKQNDWVEVSGDQTDLDVKKAGTIVQVQKVDEAQRIITFGVDISSHKNEGHQKVRRWDTGPDTVSSPTSTVAGPINLEDGVQILFSGSNFKVGDYWVFAARAVNGQVEELDCVSPRGIEHHYCKLALVTWKDDGTAEIEDCRKEFPPLTEIERGEGCCTAIVHPGEDIQAALDALPESGGCICLKSGTHNITEAIRIEKSNVVLHGESPGTRMERRNGVNLLILSWKSNNVTVEGISFVFKPSLQDNSVLEDHTALFEIPAIIILERCQKVIVKDCDIAVESDELMGLIGIWIGICADIKIRDNHVSSVMQGLWVMGGEGIEISDNKIVGWIYLQSPEKIAAGQTGVKIEKELRATNLNFGQIEPGKTLPNPFQWGSVSFNAVDQPNNRIIDQYPPSPNQDGRGELDLWYEMEVTGFPISSKVKAEVVHFHPESVTMKAYRGTKLVGSQTAGPEQGQIHVLTVAGDGIDRIVFNAPQGEASLLEFGHSFWVMMSDVYINRNSIENFWIGTSVDEGVERAVVSANEIIVPETTIESPGERESFGIKVATRNCLVKENYVENYAIGVSVDEQAEKSIIERNRVLRPPLGGIRTEEKIYGIDVSAPYCDIYGNDLNLAAPFHGGIRGRGSHTRIEANIIQSEVLAPGQYNSIPIGIYLSPGQQLPLKNVVIRCNHLLGLQCGIAVFGKSPDIEAADVQILDNHIQSISLGRDVQEMLDFPFPAIALSWVRSARVVGNNIAYAEVGIWQGISRDPQVLQNNILNIDLFGIFLMDAREGSIKHNNLSNAVGGITILDLDSGTMAPSGTMVISGNQVENMKEHGILVANVEVFDLPSEGFEISHNRVAWCGYAPVTGYAPVVGYGGICLFHVKNASIDNCEVLYTGRRRDGEISLDGALGISLFFVEGDYRIQANRIAGADEVKHLPLWLAPYSWFFVKLCNAQVLDNTFIGMGSTLVLLGEFFGESQPLVNATFSNNRTEHKTVETPGQPEPATVNIAANNLSVLDNQIRADDPEFPSFSFTASYLTAIGNISSGAWNMNVSEDHVKPRPAVDFNHISVP